MKTNAVWKKFAIIFMSMFIIGLLIGYYYAVLTSGVR
jgi:hypothetical protein